MATRPAGRITETEKGFRGRIVNLARAYGWAAFFDVATNAPRRCPACHRYVHGPRNPPGWPDLTLAKDGRLLFRELKVGKGKLEPEQERWRDALLATGADWAEWRPEQWQEIVEVLVA